MSVKIKVSDSFHNVKSILIKVGDSWKDCKNIYVKDASSGAWKAMWSYGYTYTSYGTCSQSCGGGIKTRNATCYRKDNSGNLLVMNTFIGSSVASGSSAYCGKTASLQASCNTQACTTCTYSVTESLWWTNCFYPTNGTFWKKGKLYHEVGSTEYPEIAYERTYLRIYENGQEISWEDGNNMFLCLYDESCYDTINSYNANGYKYTPGDVATTCDWGKDEEIRQLCKTPL